MISRNWTRWMALGDTHGNMADPEAIETAMEFAEYFKPDIRIHGGDAWDFPWLRRGASAEECRSGVTEDIEDGCDFMRRYRPTHFLWGNHDIRVLKAHHSDDGKLSAFASAILDKIHLCLPSGCITFPYSARNGVMEFGDWSVVHGYASGINATRKQALTYGNVMTFHNHRVDCVSVERLPRVTGMCGGCLCQLEQDYNSTQIGAIAQQHGFYYGWQTTTGELVVQQARKVADHWVFPTELKELT